MDSFFTPGTKRFPRLVFFSLWLIWLVWLTHHYFAHSPFLGMGFMDTLLSDLRDARGAIALTTFVLFIKTLLLDLAFLLVFWAWGRRLGKILGFREMGPMAPILETALGMALVQIFWVGWGLNRLWFERLIFPLVLFALGMALWDVSQILLKGKTSVFPIPSSPFDRWLGGLCLLTILFSLGQAALPDVYFDSLTYHLFALRGWLQTHGFSNLSTNLYTAFPFGGEMDFLGAFHWGSSEAAKGLNVFILVLLALAAGTWVWEEGGKNSAFLAAGLVLGFPLLVSGAWTAQVDLMQAFLTLLFFYCLSHAGSSIEPAHTNHGPRLVVSAQWAWITGILGGAILAVKYTALLSLGVGFLVWGTALYPAIRKKPSLIWGWVVPSLFLFLPWVLKNWVYTANPLYPYFGSWFGGHGLPAGQMAQLMQDHVQSFGPGETFLLWARRVFTRDLDKTIAPVLFSFLPLLLLVPKAKGLAMKLLAAGFLTLFLSLAVTHQLRLGLGGLVTCFVGMSLYGESYLESGYRKVWKGAILVFFVLNLTSLFRLGFLFYGDGRVWDGAESRQDYLTHCAQTATYYPLAQACDRCFFPHEKLLVAGDARGLYYPRPVMTNSAFDVQVMADLARQRPDGDGIALGLREMGVEGLAVAKEEGARLSRTYSQYPLTDEQWGKIDDFVQRHTRLVELTPLGGLYRISSESLPKQTPVPDLFLCFKPLSGS